MKCYAYIFVCFTTKSVHIKVVVDLSTKSFLNALNRFFIDGEIFHNLFRHATYFVGVNRQLKKVHELFLSQGH